MVMCTGAVLPLQQRGRMTDEARTIEIELERIERLTDMVSLMTVSELEAALAFIEVGKSEDRFTVLELALSTFVHELIDVREENAAHIATLEANREDAARKLETIERQQAAIRELSTPIIELWDDILTLPLVGTIDTQRALELTEQLLERVAESGARFVILDVTGIEVIDTMTANHFVQLIRAVQLLGARCVLTGVSPNIARTVVEIGIDFGTVETLRSLKEGLVYCLRQLHT